MATIIIFDLCYTGRTKKRRAMIDWHTNKKVRERGPPVNSSKVLKGDDYDDEVLTFVEISLCLSLARICSIKSNNQMNISFVINQIMRMTKRLHITSLNMRATWFDFIKFFFFFFSFMLSSFFAVPPFFLLSRERALVCVLSTHTHAHL